VNCLTSCIWFTRPVQKRWFLFFMSAFPCHHLNTVPFAAWSMEHILEHTHTHRVDEAVHIWFPSLQFPQRTNGLAYHHDRGVDLQSHPRTQNETSVLLKITHAFYLQSSYASGDAFPSSHAALNLGWPGTLWPGGTTAVSRASTYVDGRCLHLGTTHNN